MARSLKKMSKIAHGDCIACTLFRQKDSKPVTMNRNWETCRDWIIHFSGSTVQKEILQISGSGFFPISAESVQVKIDFEDYYSIENTPQFTQEKPNLRVKLSERIYELNFLDSYEATFDLVVVTDLLYFDDIYDVQVRIHEILLSNMKVGAEIVFFHSMDSVVIYPPSGLIELDSWVFEAEGNTYEVQRKIRYE
jgi:hypothetical protein